jgi:hypothetical protein
MRPHSAWMISATECWAVGSEQDAAAYGEQAVILHYLNGMSSAYQP